MGLARHHRPADQCGWHFRGLRGKLEPARGRPHLLQPVDRVVRRCRAAPPHRRALARHRTRMVARWRLACLPFRPGRLSADLGAPAGFGRRSAHHQPAGFAAHRRVVAGRRVARLHGRCHGAQPTGRLGAGRHSPHASPPRCPRAAFRDSRGWRHPTRPAAGQPRARSGHTRRTCLDAGRSNDSGLSRPATRRLPRSGWRRNLRRTNGRRPAPPDHAPCRSRRSTGALARWQPHRLAGPRAQGAELRHHQALRGQRRWQPRQSTGRRAGPRRFPAPLEQRFTHRLLPGRRSRRHPCFRGAQRWLGAPGDHGRRTPAWFFPGR